MEIEDDPNKVIIFNEDTGEDMVMECEGEELEPIEYIDEFFDYDNPIQYTYEQMSFHLLNLLSFNDTNVLKNKTFWNRRSREFVDTFKMISIRNSKNTKLLPVILANKIMIVESDSDSDDDDDKEKADELIGRFETQTTISKVLSNRANLLKSNESYIKNYPKFLYAEKVWNMENIQDKIYRVPMRVDEDTFGYLFTNNFQQDSLKRNVFLFGPLENLFDGDLVNVVGYVYMINNNFPTIAFDPNIYVENLKNLSIGDDVYVFFNFDDIKRKGVVKIITDSEITVQIKDTDITISKTNIHDNDYFVYSTVGYNPEQTFYKYILRKYNISFTLLNGDTDMSKTKKMFCLNSSELVYLLHDEINNIYSFNDFQTTLKNYGLSPYDFDEKMYVSLKETIEHNVLKTIQSLPSKNPIRKKIRKEFRSSFDILNLKKHENKLSSYEGYSFYNHLFDTEYNRMKYITKRHDNGLIYFTQIISEYSETLFTHIDKNKVDYDKELIEINKELVDLQSKYKHVECSTFQPEIKKVYTDIYSLEKDNFVPLGGIKEGDYSKLTVYTDNKHKNKMDVYYKRVFLGSDSGNIKEFWVKDKQLTYNLCSDKNEIGDHKDLSKQKCVYDDKEKLCSMKEYLILKNNINSLEHRKAILRKIQMFHNNYDKIKYNQQETLQWLRQMLALSSLKIDKEMYQENDVDYSDFVGDAGMDDEEKYGHGEVGENIKYTILKPTEDEDDNEYSKPKPKEFNEHIADSLVRTFGIVVSNTDIDYIIENHDYYNSETKFNHTLQIEKNKLKTAALGKLKQVIASHPTASKSQLQNLKDRLQRDLDDKLQRLETQYKDVFNKNSVLYICALFVLIVQLKLPDVSLSSGFTSCLKDYGLEGFPVNDNPKSLIKYIACIIRSVSSPNNERLSSVSKLTQEQIYAGIKEKITSILADKVDEREQLKQVAFFIKEDHKKPSSTSTYNEWDSYRPFVNISETDNSNIALVNYLHLLYEISRKSSLTEQLNKEVTMMTGFMKNDIFSQLYEKLQLESNSENTNKAFIERLRHDSPPELLNDKEFVIHRASLYHVKGPVRVKYDVFDNVVKETLEKLDDIDYWDVFPNTIGDYLETYISKHNFTLDSVRSINTTMFNIIDEKPLVLRSSMRNFVFDDLKTILGKISNLWKADYKWVNGLVQLDKKKKEHDKVFSILSSSDTISDINALITHDKELHEKLSEKIHFITSKIIYSYETYDVKSEDGEYIKKNIYLYEYLIMYVVYSLIDAIAPNGNGNIFDISHISNISTTTDTVLQQRLMIVFDIGKYILETMVKKVISNSYNSVDISSVNEDLREKRKEAIINKLDKLSSDDRKMVLELKKRGIIARWDELDFSKDDIIPEPDGDDRDINEMKMKSGKDDENMFEDLNKAEEEENDEIHYKGRDAEDDYDDYSDDELIIEDI